MLKRFFRSILMAAVLTLCLSGACGAEERLYAVQLADGALLTDAEGAEIVPPGEYSVIFEIYGSAEGMQLFAGEAAEGENAGYALLNGSGERITEFVYQTFEYADGAVLFMQNDRWGVMDMAGNVVIEPAYTRLLACGEGQYLGLRSDPYDDSPDAVYRIDGQGAEQAAGVRITDGLYAMADGLCCAADADSGLYGYLNAQGEWAILPSYEWAGNFQAGRAAASESGGTGLIDGQGNWLIPPEYDRVSAEEPGQLIFGMKDGTVDVIHPDTLTVIHRYEGAGMTGWLAETGEAVIVQESGVLLVSADGGMTKALEGLVSARRWPDMGDRMIVQTGEYGTGSVYLYRLDGTELSGPYQEIMPLGMLNGEMHYLFISFEAEQKEYGDAGLSFWDEKPGTRKCGVLGPDGTELCALDAEYISYLGEGRVLIQREGGAALADFSGNIIREYENPESGDALQ